MCKFQFVVNNVRDLSLDFESQVLTGERKEKNTCALRSAIFLGALLSWLHLGFIFRCLLVFMYMHGVSMSICICGHTMRT